MGIEGDTQWLCVVAFLTRGESDTGLADFADRDIWNIPTTPSIHRHAACLDRTGPFLDFALDEPGKILRRRTLVGSHRGAEFQDAHAHGGRVQGLYERAVERLHDGVRGAPGQKERGPGVGL